MRRESAHSRCREAQRAHERTRVYGMIGHESRPDNTLHVRSPMRALLLTRLRRRAQ